jgi:hypothetical protein
VSSVTGTDDLRNALRFRCVRRALVLRLAGALASAVPDGVAAVAGRPRRRATAVVTGAPVSTIDVKTRKHSNPHHRRHSPRRGGGHAVSPVTGTLQREGNTVSSLRTKPECTTGAFGLLLVGHSPCPIMRSRGCGARAARRAGRCGPGRVSVVAARSGRRVTAFRHQRRQWHGVDDRRVTRARPHRHQRRLAAVPRRDLSPNLIQTFDGQGPDLELLGQGSEGRPGPEPTGPTRLSPSPDQRRWRSAAPDSGSVDG